MEKTKIRFNIGVAGFLDKDRDTSVYRQKIIGVLDEIRDRVYINEQKAFATDADDMRIDLYTSPHIADEFWCDICRDWGRGDLRLVLSEDDATTPGSKFGSTPNTYTTTIANTMKSFALANTMIDWVTSQIDIAVMLWDGNENAHSGHMWNFVEHCKSVGVPCIWIDTQKSEGKFWFQDIYPVEYDKCVLREYIDGFYTADDLPKEPIGVTPRTFPLSNVWKYLATKYEKMLRISPVFDVTKKVDGSSGHFEDSILRHTEDREKGIKPFKLERPQNIGDNDFSAIESNYLDQRKAFHDYEDAADRIAPIIRGTLFCRTWIPFFTAFCLAVGINLKDIMSSVGKSNTVWMVLAGCAFFLSAFVCLYDYFNRKPHKTNLNKYVVCRYVGEYLRVCIHFMAYGLPVSEHILNKAIRNSDDPAKQLAAGRVRRLLRKRAPANIKIDALVCWNMLEHLNEFFESQIRYQETGRVLRFGGIRKSIQKWIPIFFIVTVITLFVRGIVQVLGGSGQLKLFEGLPQVDMILLITAIITMCALILTAWYDKLVRQDDMNRYSGYHHIAEKILKVLRIYKERLVKIRSDYQIGEKRISYERIRTLADDTLDSLINELYMWCDETVPRSQKDVIHEQG